ncbi:MAG: hypothetical protein ABUT20_42315, partial [Bacteroidota bacterium]
RSSDASPLRKNTSWMRWQYICCLLQLPVFVPAGIVYLTNSQAYHVTTGILPATAILLSTLTLFAAPRILYSPNFIMPRRRDALNLDNPFIQQLSSQLEKIMRDERPFLDPDYTLNDLAGATGIPSHKLSSYINQFTGRNFSDYVNQWRIAYCLELMQQKKALKS